MSKALPILGAVALGVVTGGIGDAIFGAAAAGADAATAGAIGATDAAAVDSGIAASTAAAGVAPELVASAGDAITAAGTVDTGALADLPDLSGASVTSTSDAINAGSDAMFPNPGTSVDPSLGGNPALPPATPAGQPTQNAVIGTASLNSAGSEVTGTTMPPLSSGQNINLPDGGPNGPSISQLNAQLQSVGTQGRGGGLLAQVMSSPVAASALGSYVQGQEKLKQQQLAYQQTLDQQQQHNQAVIGAAKGGLLSTNPAAKLTVAPPPSLPIYGG